MTAVSASSTPTPALAPSRLAEHAQAIADRPEEWIQHVRLSTDGRWYTRLHADVDHEVWLISWLPGQATGFHDHGGASGAFSVVWGVLDERVVPPGGRGATTAPVTRGVVRAVGPHYIHDVRNTSEDTVAVSVHAYSPPLTAMTRYHLTAGGLVASGFENQEDW
jgi:predicted metal-dependent enzyme (double-stranded beta helix superfamily)